MKKEILFEGDSHAYEDWGLTPWSYNRANGDGRDIILNFLKMITFNEKSNRVYWFRPYSVKHDIERWQLGNPKHVYIRRDLVTAACLFMGIPVKMDPNDQNNTRIGFKLTPKQYNNIIGEAEMYKLKNIE